MDELIARLGQICQAKKIQKFSPEEMVELLEDGETADWIVGQVLSAGSAEEIEELSGLLEQIAVEVAPVAEETGEAEEVEVEEVEVGEVEAPDWDELENLPLPPGVDLDQVKQLLASPQGELLADFSAFCQERGVDAEAGQEGMEEVMRELHEEWLQTPRESLEGRKPADALGGGGLFPGKVETFRRETPKVGRNDPCPCGSGKKYKKCCGKGA